MWQEGERERGKESRVRLKCKKKRAREGEDWEVERRLSMVLSWKRVTNWLRLALTLSLRLHRSKQMAAQYVGTGPKHYLIVVFCF